MFVSRNKLYALVLLACVGGYVWLFYNFFIVRKIVDNDFGICIFKEVTNIPCPSCGTTRSIVSLLHGDFVNTLFWNPLGIIVLLIMIISPIWIIFDLIIKQNTFHKFYRHFETVLRQKKYAIPLIGLIISNWIWNIYKGL